MAMYLGEDKVASLGSICNVSGSASKNLFDAYKYSENKTHTGNVSKYSIINPNEIEISYINGWSRLVLTLTGLEPNTDYTISAYLDKSNFSTSVGSGFYALDNYRDNAFTKGSGNVYFTFTSSSAGTFDMWFYGNWSGTNYSGSIIYQNIQLEKGSATEYEEYYEPIISIKDSKGDYHEVPYMTGKVSKNLFNKDTMVEFKNGYRLYTDGTFNNNSSFYGLKIPVQPNTTYTSSSNLTDTNLWSDLCFFDKGMNFISGVEGRANKTFTTPTNCYFVTYAIYNQYQWFQLEKGSNATEYEKYFEPTILIRNNNGIFQEVLNVNEKVGYKGYFVEGSTTIDITFQTGEVAIVTTTYKNDAWKPMVLLVCALGSSLQVNVLGAESDLFSYTTSGLTLSTKNNYSGHNYTTVMIINK